MPSSALSHESSCKEEIIVLPILQMRNLMLKFPQALCCFVPLSFSPSKVACPTQFWLRVLPPPLEKGKTLRSPQSP